MWSHRIFWIGCFLYCALSCTEVAEPEFERLQGQTMGTYYRITYELVPGQSEVYTFEVDSVLDFINQVASTYIPESVIGRLNNGDTIYTGTLTSEAVDFFMENIDISTKVWEWSDGYFDPTVMPLVNYWGFGYEHHRGVDKVDSARVDSLVGLVGFGKLTQSFKGDKWVLPPGMQLDFSAVAKGAACDFVGGFLEKEGIFNYLIDIGGETLAKGKGRKGEGWILGISKPDKTAPENELVEELVILDKAVATSGNYRNYYESGGKSYGHTINPKTGYPEERGILSATVIADRCGMADALATSFMAMGLEKGKPVLEHLEGIDVLLIYNNGSDSLLMYETSGLRELKNNVQ